MSEFEFIDHSAGLSEVQGFCVAGIGCDIRGKNDLSRKDLALVYSALPCTAAGTFTTNDAKAAPVCVDMAILAGGAPLHGVVANSGNANASTGKQGLENAREMAKLAARSCGAPEGSFLVCSTGRIGRQMPMERIAGGIAAAAKALGQTEAHGRAAAAAILTSDTRPKTATVRFKAAGKTVCVSAMAKGAGMIEPNMATMLCFIATDAAVSKNLIQKALSAAVSRTFNRISVDGDMSTNDTVLCLANGASGAQIAEGSPEEALFARAVFEICDNMAEKIVGDGEKITRVVEVKVEGARDGAAAEKIARAIGNSLLVKASWCGADPNWGRLVDAAGYARTGLNPDALDLDYDDVPVLRQGLPLDENLEAWKRIVQKKRFTVRLNLNMGQSAFRLLATDLTEGYVTFNKSE